MKSVFFGYSAKLALALLAVGTMTSCYEKEEVDAPVTPESKPAKYYIQGNVTSAKNGQGLQAAVTIGGVAASVNTDGYFSEEKSAGEYKVVATMKDYFDASRTVTLYPAADNSVTIATVNIAMYDVSQAIEDASKDVPASSQEAGQALKAAEGAINDALTGLGLDPSAANIEVAEGAVNVKVDEPVVVESAAVGENVTVEVPSFSGFASTITPEDDKIFTKGITDGQIWIASAEKQLGMSYGLKSVMQQVTLPGMAGKSICGFTFMIRFEPRTLEFRGATGTVIYQIQITVNAQYESHDSHDSHDSHNGHGSNPGAGGGSSQGE